MIRYTRCLILLSSVLALAFQSGSPPIRFGAERLADGIDAASAGLVTADIDGDGNPELIAWSNNGIKVFRNGSPSPINCGLGGVREVVSISPGDFNNDGLEDLAILTQSGAELWLNRKGTFEQVSVVIPEGAYNKAVWIDYDHDNDLDLFLLGDKSVLLRNDGVAGFSNLSNNFPFVAGRAVDGTLFDVTPDTNGMDLVVVYSDRPGVLYVDKLGGRYEAQDLNLIPAGAKSVTAVDLDNDGATDLVMTTASSIVPLFIRHGSFEKAAQLSQSSGALAIVDLENRGIEDIAVSGAVFRNEGMGKFFKIKVPTGDSSALAAVDFDGDGRADLIEVQRDGSLVFLRNETETSNSWLRVTLVGVNSLKLAYGSKVQLKAGTHYQKRTYSGQPLLVGMGGNKQADTVRIRWPNGTIQNEVRQAAGKAFTYRQ